MALTNDQRSAVKDDEDRMLTACPGSGKTKVVVSKLVRLIDEVRGTPRSIGCITYTNAGVYEIEARARVHLQPDDDRYFDISTIHSFCLNNIFRPFRHLVPGFKAGFKVLTQDSEEFNELVLKAYAEHGRTSLSYAEFENFTKIRVDLGGKPSGDVIEKGQISAQLAREYWALIQKRGFIDFANIIYQSYRLLRDYPHILNAVSSKFAWILVDEFQDTSDLQVELLALISAKDKTKFFLVGDSHQSIFAFAGARPDLAEFFAKKINAKTDIQLTGNFRSSSLIVADAERLRPRVPPMVAVGVNKDIVQDSEWYQDSSAYNLVHDIFLPKIAQLGIPIGASAVLAPAWFTLYDLARRLRNAGVPVVGPGARPYRRSRHFAPIAEAVCGYLIEQRPEALFVLERTLFHTLVDITGRRNFSIFSYDGRRVVFQLLASAKALHGQFPRAMNWLDAAAVEFTTILMRSEYLSPSEEQIFPNAVAAMRSDIISNKIDPDSLTIDDLGIYSAPNAALKLSTIHTAKGREYDAVALIDLHEKQIPSGYAKSAADYDEQQRLFYVGVTRARKYLMYGSLSTKTTSRYLSEVGFQT